MANSHVEFTRSEALSLYDAVDIIVNKSACVLLGSCLWSPGFHVDDISKKEHRPALLNNLEGDT